MVPAIALTCFVGKLEHDVLIGNAADVANGRDARVVGIVLRSEVLQLQDLRLPLQLRSSKCVKFN